MQVRLVKNGEYWVARYRDATGRVRGKGLGHCKKINKTVARRRCMELARQMIEKPGYSPSNRAPTLEAWQKHYTSLRTNLSDGTEYLHGDTFRCLCTFFGKNTRLSSITRHSAAVWRAWLGGTGQNDLWPSEGQGMAEATVCRHIRTAKVIFGWACRTDILPLNPFDRESGNAPEPDKSQWTTLTTEQVKAYIDNAPAPVPQWRALLGLCAYAGLRRGEAYKLTWDRIHFDRHRLAVTSTKRTGSKDRTRDVLMSPELEAILTETQASAQKGEPRICHGINPDSLTQPAKAAARRAGIHNITDPFQSLRRWRDRTWKLDYPAYVVDSWLGHSAAVSQRHYLSVPEEMYRHDDRRAKLAAAIRKLPDDELDQVEALVFRKVSAEKSGS